MPWNAHTQQHFDFEAIDVFPHQEVATVMARFFANHPEIVGDKAWIMWHIGQRVQETRHSLSSLGDPILGQTLFIQHPVIPDENGGREYYVYALQVFVQ